MSSLTAITGLSRDNEKAQEDDAPEYHIGTLSDSHRKSVTFEELSGPGISDDD